MDSLLPRDAMLTRGGRGHDAYLLRCLSCPGGSSGSRVAALT